MSYEDEAVRVDQTEVRRLYRVVLEIQAKISDLPNQAEKPEDLEWARLRCDVIEREQEGDLRHLREGNAQWMRSIFRGAVMNSRPLDEAPADLLEHVDANIRPLTKQLGHEYRLMTRLWYDWEDSRGTLRPEVAVQLEPIMKAIAADVDAGRWP